MLNILYQKQLMVQTNCACYNYLFKGFLIYYYAIMLHDDACVVVLFNAAIDRSIQHEEDKYAKHEEHLCLCVQPY
jgi:hypothetical protein